MDCKKSFVFSGGLNNSLVLNKHGWWLDNLSKINKFVAEISMWSDFPIMYYIFVLRPKITT